MLGPRQLADVDPPGRGCRRDLQLLVPFDRDETGLILDFGGGHERQTQPLQAERVVRLLEVDRQAHASLLPVGQLHFPAAPSAALIGMKLLDRRPGQTADGNFGRRFLGQLEIDPPRARRGRRNAVRSGPSGFRGGYRRTKTLRR